MELCERYVHLDKQEMIALVELAQQGDREAFNVLCESFRRAIYATALQQLHGHGAAQEIVQQVFIQAFRKLGQLTNPACFGGWVRTIARRMSINYAKRRRPTVSLDVEQCEDTLRESSTPLGAVLAEERRLEVHVGLGRLKPLDRKTLVAFYIEGQSLIEMADAFQSPVGTIKRRLHTARKRLAKELAALAPA